MRLPRLFQKDSPGEKEHVYDLASTIERESGHRLTATPCEDGIAVSDGRAIHFVEPMEIASHEALRLHIKFWLTGKPEIESPTKTSATAYNDTEPELYGTYSCHRP
jgi:hypothetical protein